MEELLKQILENQKQMMNDISGMKEDIAEIKEDSAITRESVNELLSWSDRISSKIGADPVGKPTFNVIEN